MEKENLERKKTLLKLDTGKDGLLALWTEYQAATIDELLIHEERKSGEIHHELKRREVKTSRASVINFLNSLVDEGLVAFREATGKGGYHRIYSLKARSWPEFNNTIIDMILFKLWEIFPDNERIKLVLAK